MAMTRQQKREKMIQKRAAATYGDGLYIYQNITGADLMLSRPTKAGRRTVGPREKFIGDSYYKNMKEVVCLQEVQAPMQEQKLITEVPPLVTHDGQVEYVQTQPEDKPLTEEDKQRQAKNPDVLLTEAPLDGIRIMR